MDVEEVKRVRKWVKDVSKTYGVPRYRVKQVYKAIRKHHEMVETKNMIEYGLLLRRGVRK